MKKFWEVKGKRILAFVLAVFVFTCAIPNSGFVYAEEASEDSVVTISGNVLVPTEDDETVTEGYAEANVTVKLNSDADSKEATGVTDENGAYSIEVADWTLEENQTCELIVTPADGDAETYESGSVTYTVTAEDVTAGAFTITDITLAKKSVTDIPTFYTVSVTGSENGGGTVVIKTDDAETANSAQVEANGTFTITATPNEGYQITSVVVTNDGTTWVPDGEDVTNTEWWSLDADGKFTYTFTLVDKDYDVNVIFTEINKYAISATANNADYGTVEVLYVDGSAVSDAGNVYEGSDIKIVADPNEKYEITNISVKKYDDTVGAYVDVPESTTDGWWAVSGANWTMEDGTFTYTITDIDANYTISIDFEAIPEYTINASVKNSIGGSIVINDADGMAQENGSLVLRDEERIIVATPDAGYEIVGVTVKKDDGTGNYVDYIPDGAESNWWSASDVNGEWTMTNGTFTYVISSIDANYEVSVEYAIKEVTLQGTVTYPGKEGVGAYAGVTVTISYDDGKTVTATTNADGTYSVVIKDWLIEENDNYSVLVTMKDGDGVKYSQKTSSYTVSASEASSRQISKNIALELATYTISWTIAEGGELILNDAETTYNGTNELTVSYEDSYKLTVSIAEGYENMHLASVLLKIADADAAEQLTEDDKKAGNELHEKVINLENGLISDLALTVTVTIDQFDLTVETTGNGTVTLNSGESFTDNTLVVDHNASKTLLIKPEAGYQVSSISLTSGTSETVDVTYEKVTEYSKGCYSYIVSNITENTLIEVVFTEIPVITYSWENPQFTIERIIDKGTETFMPTESNPNSFGNEFVICSNTDEATKTLYIGDAEKYEGSVTISETTLLNKVYMRDKAFGTEQIIEIPKTITLYIDNSAPEFSDSMQVEFWEAKDATTVTIPVTVSDTNLDYVVCTSQSDLDATTISKESGILAVGEIGALVISDAPLATGELKDVYYLYAVDKAGNCSVAKAVTIYRDDTEPVITATSITPIDAINKKAYGNFYNGTVTFALTIADVVSEATDNMSSDIAYAVISINGTEDKKISVADMQAGSSDGEYIINFSYAADDKFTELSSLSVTIVDNCGNSTTYKLSELDSTFKSDLLKLESVAPVVTITPSVKDGGTADQDEFWYKNDTWEIVYKATDAGTGLAQYKVFVNDTLVINEDYAAKADATGNYADISKDTTTLDLATKVLDAMVEGSNTLKIEFVDLAGNTGSDTATICLDNHVPRIARFDLEVEKTGVIEKFINWLLFGNYSNGDVIITVTADDITDADGTGSYATSGLDEITLYLDGEVTGEPTVVDANGKAEFKVSLEDVQGDSVYYQRIHATVTDKVGNGSTEYDMTTGNSDLENSGLMIETIKPTITAEVVKDEAHQWKNADGVIFTNAEGQFKVTASDTDSGLHSVAIEINKVEKENVIYTGSDMTVSEEKMVETGEYTVSIGTNATDGLYEMSATVVDNAGNEDVISEKLYYDTTAPTVTLFQMEAAGYSEADGAPVTETSYGYYFHEDTTIIVSVTDGTDASATGAKKIVWYTEDISGTRKEGESVVNAGKAQFEVPAEFKGQIYVCAYDQLENHAVDSEGNIAYVSPNGVIIETPEQHGQASEHIKFADAEQADYLLKDNDGNDLYNAVELKKAAEAAGRTDYLVDVNVDVIDTFSGIRSVEWSVTYPTAKDSNVSGKVEIDNTGAISASDSTVATWEKAEGATDANLVTELAGNIKITAASNDIVVKIKMTDRSGNTSELTKKLSIDGVKPVIEITFDDVAADSEYTTTYNKQRTATITVKERHFKSSNFTVAISNTDGEKPAVSEWKTEGIETNPDETTYKATVVFAADGDYTMSVSGKDIAGNTADSKKVDEFTIDLTVPTVSVTYGNNAVTNGNYYAETQTAIVEIKEHNFVDARVNVVGTATASGAQIAFPTISSFSSDGDVHTATITFATDGLYRFDIEFTDKAGNKAETFVGTEFYVDMTAPAIEITGVEDKSANNGDVIPRVVLSDANYDTNGVTITLSGANSGSVSLDGSYSTQGSGQVFTFNNFPKEQAKDDLYTLAVVLTDMAGNEETADITFSVNRFGSVYVFDDSLKEIAGTYVQEEIDVCLTEINVDSLEHDTIRVVVDANGTIKDLTEGTDYSVIEDGGNGSWYQYDYTINKSLFAGDGRYIVTLYSEDVAGNINENIDETKEAEISFGIDKTAPVVIPIDIASDEQYDLDVKTATVAVNDNLVLEDVQVFVGEAQTEYTADGENYVFDIPSASERQDITIVAVDAAGNRTNYIISGVLVTTNAFIRWYNNTPLFVGSIVGVAGLSGALVGLIGLRRRRRYKLK